MEKAQELPEEKVRSERMMIALIIIVYYSLFVSDETVNDFKN